MKEKTKQKTCWTVGSDCTTAIINERDVRNAMKSKQMTFNRSYGGPISITSYSIAEEVRREKRQTEKSF